MSDKYISERVEYFVSIPNPKITVVVPTIPSSSHETIRKTLQDQDANVPYEAFAVNDGEINICDARNIGLEIAGGDIVAFTDDDCVPNKNWVQSIYEAFDDDIVCVEGRVSGGINYDGRRGYVGCNMAVRTETGLQIGGFDDSFAGWRDDTEFGWRLEREAEGRCVYDPDVHVSHPSTPRSEMIDEHEERLKQKYSDRYDKIMNRSLTQILYRKMQKHGLIRVWKEVRHPDHG